MATSEACDCHKALLRAGHMGRKWGAAGRCQVGISHCRGHNNVSNKTKVKAGSVAQSCPFSFLAITYYWARWGCRGCQLMLDLRTGAGAQWFPLGVRYRGQSLWKTL